MGANVTSHADNHDRDKLSRWRGDLTSGEMASFPVYAVFLVTPEDRPAHDIFRAYRNSFEKRGAGFQYLMIFGQHGVSTTVRRLLAEFNLTLDALPRLVLFPDPPGDTIHTFGLRAGDYGKGEAGEPGSLAGPWMDVLAFLEHVSDMEEGSLDLAPPGSLTGHKRDSGPIMDVIDRVLAAVS